MGIADTYKRECSDTEKSMDEDQQIAFDLIKQGHNVVVMGQADCGQTHLVKQITKYLRNRQKNVSVVCSTGNSTAFHHKL